MMRAGVWWIVLGAWLVGGCPGDGDGASGSGSRESDGAAGAGSGSQDNVARLCGAHLAWDTGCDEMDPARGSTADGEPRWGGSECLEGPWDLADPRYIDAAVACFGELSCDSSDDACTDAGLAALGVVDESDVADDLDYMRCVERAHECPDFIDDLCLTLVIFHEAGRRAAITCLELECAAVGDCLRDPA